MFEIFPKSVATCLKKVYLTFNNNNAMFNNNKNHVINLIIQYCSQIKGILEVFDLHGNIF